MKWFIYKTPFKGKCCDAASAGAAPNATSVHSQAARSCRQNEIRPFPACNHSKDPLGFGRQQFSKARVAAAKWLKSPRKMMRWWEAGEAAGDPKTACNGDYLASVGVTQQPSLTPPRLSEKQKDGIWFRGQIRFVRVSVWVRRRVPCVRPHPLEIERWRHLLRGALVSGSHCLRGEMTGG